MRKESQVIAKDVKKKLLEFFRFFLEKAWLEIKAPEIQNKTDLVLEKEKTKLREKYKCQEKDVLTKIYDGIPVKDNDFLVFKKAIEAVSKKEMDLFDQYEQEERRFFNSSLWGSNYSDWSGWFNKAIDNLKLDELCDQFLDRHPWTLPTKITIATESIPEKFLMHIVSNQLLDPERLFKEGSWKKVLKKWERNPESLALPVCDPHSNLIQELLEEYPTSDIPGFYVKNIRADLDNFCSNADWRFYRVDLLRFLGNEVPAATQPGMLTMSVADIHDLNSCSQQQYHHLRALFINMGDESEPLWGLAHKNNEGHFELYLPEKVDKKSNDYQTVMNRLAVKQVHMIAPQTYQDNLQLNDIKIEDETVWHVILLTRIFPKVISGESWEEYRKKTPLPVLMQHAFLIDLYKVITGHHKRVAKAFVSRQPISKYKLSKAYQQIGFDLKEVNSLFEKSEFENSLAVISTLRLFDEGILHISDNLDTLIIDQDNSTTLEFIHGLNIIYHHGNINTLVLPTLQENSEPSQKETETQRFSLISKMFEYDYHLRSIQPKAITFKKIAIYDIAMSCAARNRFLAFKDGEFLEKIESEEGLRKTLWSVSGGLIAEFFREEGTHFTLDFIDDFYKKNEEWKKEFCSHHFENNFTPKAWGLAQIAQMGRQGIDAFFTHLEHAFLNGWNAIDEEPAPKLPVVFDLAGSLTDTPEYYTDYLANKIRHFENNQNQSCYPLFEPLSLILPEEMDEYFIEALLSLLAALDSRQKKYPKESHEVFLYNVPVDSPLTQKFIAKLMKQAEWHQLHILIRIPAWDRAFWGNSPRREIKANYAALQNKVLENIRFDHHQVLPKQVKALTAYQGSSWRKETTRMQSFEEPDEHYSLATHAPGIQQQLQLQGDVSMEMQQEEEQEQEQELEQQTLAERYQGNEDLLITRDNIDEHCRLFWDNLIKTEKNPTGWDGISLASLFSLWVGSDADAPQVINKMELAAVLEIMKHASQFRLGLSKENLPAGFYLAYSRDDEKKNILCFDEKRKKESLRHRQSLDPDKRNPFTLPLIDAMNAPQFKGDLRQFKTAFGEKVDYSPPQMQVLWRFLATEDEDEKRLEAVQDYCQSQGWNHVSNQDASAALQRKTAFDELEATGDLAQCFALLRSWVRTLLDGDEKLSQHFFSMENPSACTPSELQAFGQIFNHFGFGNDAQNTASDYFIQMANALLNAFGSEAFAIWKKRLLTPLATWQVCLDKEEVDAVFTSIDILKDKPHYQALWWFLVDAHGKATGEMRYAPLWQAFLKTIENLEKNDLIIHEEQCLAYFNKTPDFNGLVFLDRLNSVLKLAASYTDVRVIRQAILDQLDEIDWRHNGYYYASQYEKYPFWDATLQFTQWRPSSSEKNKTYVSTWDSKDLTLTNPTLHALRFMSQVKKLSIKEFKHLQTLMAIVPEMKSFDSGILVHLLISTLVLGVDELSALSKKQVKKTMKALAETDKHLLQALKDVLFLDKKVINLSLHLAWIDIPFFLHQLKEHGLGYAFCALNENDRLAFINAAGRALRCFPQETRVSNFQRFMVEAKKHQLKLPIVKQSCPWLLNQDFDYPNVGTEEQFPEFYCLMQQLQGIHFEESKNYPNAEQLKEALDALITRELDSKKARFLRQNFVQQWINEGCSIPTKDGSFRLLNEEEILYAMNFLEREKKRPYQDLNRVLFKDFLEKSCALSLKEDPKKQLMDLLKCLEAINNKPHYNEVGSVLGLLIQYSYQARPRCYFSLPQLTAWFEPFAYTQNSLQNHFPIDLFQQILQSSKAQSDGLLRPDLRGLKEETQHYQVLRYISEIVQLNLSQKFKGELVSIILTPGLDYNWYKKARDLSTHMYQKHLSEEWIQSIFRLVKMSFNKGDLNTYALDTLSVETPIYKECKDNDEFVKAWQNTQQKLCHWVLDKGLTFSDLTLFSSDNAKSACIRVILGQIIAEWDKTQIKSILALKENLNRWSFTELNVLAVYCATEPRPNLSQLNTLIKECPHGTTALDLTEHFEIHYQSMDASGEPKRHYSLNKGDRVGLIRVLQGIKRKSKGPISEKNLKKILNGFYYLNVFSQLETLETLSLRKLSSLLSSALNNLEQSKPSLAYLYSAQTIACLREIVLRKTGKWVNHTQILVLLYAAMYNDESLLYQVKTGEGKSIITMMRVAYLALNGKSVDVFSGKESLSKRDYKEFKPLLDTLWISSAYITAYSKKDDYKWSLPKWGRGCVNYMTVGNFALFHSTHIWNGEDSIPLTREDRVAFLDECDQVLKDEKTAFNFSENEDGQSVYNLDEWVYRVAYDYYCENIDPSSKPGEIPSISRNTDLKALCDALQRQAKQSPKASRFMAKYITPALNGHEETLQRRDEQLKQLLVAAHVAHGLKEGIHYCIRPQRQTVGHGTHIPVRFACVLIDNQIKKGSTYSELVQQFLHVRLNKEAASQGESPDFFVEPNSSIVLSQNVESVLNRYYDKIEGCTGTAGSLDDLDYYQNHYGITQVVKLPTHQPKQSVDLEPVYVDSLKAQVAILIEKILMHSGNQPLLMTCRNDLEVKKLHALVKKGLAQRDFQGVLLLDTNDSGQSEDALLPLACKIGHVTFSSRMGRGTDIKPEGNQGLMVLRTYPALPRITKQEKGRQGRYGALGICQEIINYADVLKEAKYYSRLYPDTWQALLEKEGKRLAHKKSKVYSNPEQHITACCVEIMKAHLMEEQEAFLRKKDALIAACSTEIMDAILAGSWGKNFDLDAFKAQWIFCRRRIESAFNACQHSGDDFDTFKEEAMGYWYDLCASYSQLKMNIEPTILKTIPVNKEITPPRTKIALSDLDNIVYFYQTWVQSAQHYLLNQKLSSEVITAILGTREDKGKLGLHEFFSELFSTSYPGFNSLTYGECQRQFLFQELEKLFKNNVAYLVPLSDWSALIAALPSCFTIGENAEAKVQAIFSNLHFFFNLPLFKNKSLKTLSGLDIERRGLLLQLLFGIFQVADVDKIALDCERFIGHLSTVMLRDFSDAMDKNLISQLLAIFGQNTAVANVFIRHTNKADLSQYINLIIANMNQGELNTSAQELKDYLKTHVDYLDRYPGLLRSVFNISLGKGESSYLPLPAILKHQDPAEQTLFWEFLADKSPFDEGSFNVFMAAIEKLQGKEKAFFESLFLASDALSLDDISKIIEEAFDAKEAVLLLKIEEKETLLQALGKEHALKGFSQDFQEEVYSLDEPLQAVFFESLLALADGVNPAYIEALLHRDLGRYSLGDARHHLSNILNAKKAFDAFASSRAKVDVQHLLQYFYRLTPKQNEFFFNQAKQYPNVPLEVIEALLRSFCENPRMDWLSRGFCLINDIQKLDKRTQQFTWDRLLEQLDKNSFEMQKLQNWVGLWQEKPEVEENLEQWYAYLTTYSQGVAEAKKAYDAFMRKFPNKKESYFFFDKITDINALFFTQAAQEPLLKEIVIDDLWNAVKHNKPFALKKQHIKRLFIQARAIQNLSDETAKQFSQEKFLQDIRTNHYNRKRFDSWLAALSDYQDLKEDYLESLYANHCQDEEQTAILLNELERYREHAEHLKDETQFNDYFGTLKAKQKKARAGIMQYLYHGILDLDNDLERKCYDAYQKLSQNVLILPDDVHTKSISFRQQTFRQAYQSIREWALELKQVISYPIAPKNNNNNQEEKASQVINKHASYFENKRTLYASFWFTSQDRKEQAKNVFDVLGAQTSSEMTLEEYYQNVLNEIWAGQKLLLETDKDTKRNKKGYSRLHDIYTHMFLTVAKDCFAEPDISLQNKAKLHDLCEEQFLFHVNMLQQRWPSQQFKSKGEALKEAMAKLNKKDFPKHLHYLVDNIQATLGLVGDADNGRSHEADNMLNDF